MLHLHRLRGVKAWILTRFERHTMIARVLGLQRRQALGGSFLPRSLTEPSLLAAWQSMPRNGLFLEIKVWKTPNLSRSHLFPLDYHQDKSQYLHKLPLLLHQLIPLPCRQKLLWVILIWIKVRSADLAWRELQYQSWVSRLDRALQVYGKRTMGAQKQGLLQEQPRDQTNRIRNCLNIQISPQIRKPPVPVHQVKALPSPKRKLRSKRQLPFAKTLHLSHLLMPKLPLPPWIIFANVTANRSHPEWKVQIP